MTYGNQHASRYGLLMETLHQARAHLRQGRAGMAEWRLHWFWTMHAQAPASTRRRWKCGR